MEENRYILLINPHSPNVRKVYEHLKKKKFPVKLVADWQEAMSVIFQNPIGLTICLAKDYSKIVQEFRRYNYQGSFIALLDSASNISDNGKGTIPHVIKDFSDLSKIELLVSILFSDNHKRSIMLSPLVQWKENYSLTIPSDFLYIDRAISYLLKKITFTKATYFCINSIRMSLAEALSNAIDHGNRQDISKKVYIRMEITKKYVKITIRDEGEGFDFKKQMADLTELNKRYSERGRGLYIIHQFMDEVEFKPPGNTIVMKKYLFQRNNQFTCKQNKEHVQTSSVQTKRKDLTAERKK